jgi:hypothetical protein
MPFNVAIAGISSRLAREVASELLKQPCVRIRGSSRDVEKLPPFLTGCASVTLIQSRPNDREILRSLVKGCDVVICCYYADNETMVEAQKLLIDLCEQEKVPRYIASDYTADYTKLDWGDIVIKDPMKHVNAYLLSQPHVKGVHILVGLLMETFWAYFNVWDPKENKVRYWGTGNEEWELTTYHTTAQYVAAVVLDSGATGIKKCKARLQRFPPLLMTCPNLLHCSRWRPGQHSGNCERDRVGMGSSAQAREHWVSARTVPKHQVGEQ